jgi:hypothetical protein
MKKRLLILRSPKDKEENHGCMTRIFFVDNIKSALTVSQSFKDNEPVNLTNTLYFYNEIDCVVNFNEYEIRLLHHNVQSLNNKSLVIANH